jgi:hypothetical protein
METGEGWRALVARWWPVAPGALVGGYLTYQLGYASSQGGLGAALGAAVLLPVIGGLVVVGFIAGAALQSSRRGRAAGRALIVATVALGATVIAATIAVPTLGLGHRDPVTLQARGSAALSLSEPIGFEPAPGNPARCSSLPGQRVVGAVFAEGLGELEGASLRGTISPPSSGQEGMLELFVDGADVPGGSAQPFWHGRASFTGAADGTSGTATFDRLALQVDSDLPGAGIAWPAVLAGEITWACDPWRDPNALLPEPTTGTVTLELPGEDLAMSGAPAVTCEFEEDASVAVVVTSGGLRPSCATRSGPSSASSRTPISGSRPSARPRPRPRSRTRTGPPRSCGRSSSVRSSAGWASTSSSATPMATIPCASAAP